MALCKAPSSTSLCSVGVLTSYHVVWSCTMCCSGGCFGLPGWLMTSEHGEAWVRFRYTEKKGEACQEVDNSMRTGSEGWEAESRLWLRRAGCR